MNLTNRQIRFYKGYILPSILIFYKDVDCPKEFSSVENIDAYFKSKVQRDLTSLKQFSHEDFDEMITYIYHFCDEAKITDPKGERIKCLSDYDENDYFKSKN